MDVDPYLLSNNDLWVLIVGAALPLVISVLTRSTWSGKMKTAVMLVSVFVATTVGEILAGRLTEPGSFMEWVRSVFIVFIVTATSYRNVWKPLHVTEKIERVTSPDLIKLEEDDDK